MDAFALEFILLWCGGFSSTVFVSEALRYPWCHPWPRRSAGVGGVQSLFFFQRKRRTGRQAGEVDLHIVSGRGYICIPPFTGIKHIARHSFYCRCSSVMLLVAIHHFSESLSRETNEYTHLPTTIEAIVHSYAAGGSLTCGRPSDKKL
jgi:hypothetical protein